MAWETHRYLKNQLCIVRARGRGLLDHPYAPCHPPSVPPTEEHLVGHPTNYCHQMSSCGLYILFLYGYIEYHMSLVNCHDDTQTTCISFCTIKCSRLHWFYSQFADTTCCCSFSNCCCYYYNTRGRRIVICC